MVFSPTHLSKQAGYVDVQLADLDGDGALQIVALLAQHTESIEVWHVHGKTP